jgi:DNA invertase Pin-like site-specific DNA recombinase
VGFRSYQEACLDTVGPFADVILALFATFAKLERSRLIERTKAGLQRARAEGKTLGRPKLVVDRARIAEMRVAGLSFAKIANELGCSPAFIHKTCRQWKPASAGNTKAGATQ